MVKYLNENSVDLKTINVTEMFVRLKDM